MAENQFVSATDALAEEWFIESEQGWSLWITDVPFQEVTNVPFRYYRGKTLFEASFQSEFEGVQTNLSTGKVRCLRKQRGQPSPEVSEKVYNGPAKLSVRPAAYNAKPQTKIELPTCAFLATSGAQSYAGEFEWVIELEKGWSPWMPGNQPFDGCTDQPLRYTLGRYDFEVNFESEIQGIQTNLSTGKVRRIQRRQKSDPLPAWEGTGTRRRSLAGNSELPTVPESSAASVAQAQRAQRRGYCTPEVLVSRKPQISERPRVSQAAYQTTKPEIAAVPHYMRALKSKSQAQP